MIRVRPPRATGPSLSSRPPRSRGVCEAEATRGVERVAPALLEMGRDVTGHRRAFREAGGAAALRLLIQGDWFWSALRGRGRTVYPGDLARLGRLGAQRRALDAARRLAERSPHAARLLEPGLRRLDDALELIVARSTPELCLVAEALDAALSRRGTRQARSRRPAIHPVARRGTSQAITHRADIRRRFRFRTWTHAGRVYKEARGRLGVPGRVAATRCHAAQTAMCEAFAGDDAGHLIAAAFGAPGDARNLAPQTPALQRHVRQPSGAPRIPPIYRRMEQEWAALLAKGFGVQVRIVDVAGAQAPRSSGRRVFYALLDPTGRPTSHTFYPGNFPYIAPSERARRAASSQEE